MKGIVFSTFAILENGSPELDPPPGVEVPRILNISIDGTKVSDTEEIEISPLMNMKFLEVCVTGPQGIGSTCRWKEVE